MPKRINAFPTTATSPADDDFILLDGATNNSRKLLLARFLAAQRNALAPRGGVAFDGTLGARVWSALTNQNVGSAPCSLVGVTRAPLVAPSSDTQFLGVSDSATDIANSPSAMHLSWRTSGALRLMVVVGGVARQAELANAVTLFGGKVLILFAVKNASGDPTLYVNGLSIPLSWGGAASPNGVISSAFLNVGYGNSAIVSASPIYSISFYNFALTQTDVTEIVELGGGVPERYKSGSQANLASTNFAAAGYETFTGASPAGFTQAVNTTGDALAWATPSLSVVAGQVYRASFTLTLNSGTAPNMNVRVPGGTSYSSNIPTSAGANTIDHVITSTGSNAAALFSNNVGQAADYSVSGFSLVRLGAIVHLPLNDGAGLQLRDDSTNRLHALMTTAGVTHVLPLFGGAFPVRFVTSTNGNQQALGASCVPLNCQILRVRARTQSGTATVSLGNASGGAQIVSAAALTTSWQVLTIVGGAHITSTQNLWVSSNSASVVEWDIELEEVRL
jgi:hypothetical protein